MGKLLERYYERMTDSELAFLARKQTQQVAMYYKFMRIAMVVSFVAAFAGAWYRATQHDDFAFSPLRYFISVAIFLSVFCSAIYIAFYKGLKHLRQDLTERIKVVDRLKIDQKVAVPATNQYYIYINSPVKMSIELSVADFEQIHEDDEINIEYAKYTQEYFGYF